MEETESGLKDGPVEKLTDNSFMPFGKHGGEKLQMSEVPASYLLWLWNDGLYEMDEPTKESHRVDKERWAVRCYIEDCMSVLKKDDDDTIVKGVDN